MGSRLLALRKVGCSRLRKRPLISGLLRQIIKGINFLLWCQHNFDLGGKAPLPRRGRGSTSSPPDFSSGSSWLLGFSGTVSAPVWGTRAMGRWVSGREEQSLVPTLLPWDRGLPSGSKVGPTKGPGPGTSPGVQPGTGRDACCLGPGVCLYRCRGAEAPGPSARATSPSPGSRAGSQACSEPQAPEQGGFVVGSCHSLAVTHPWAGHRSLCLISVCDLLTPPCVLRSHTEWHERDQERAPPPPELCPQSPTLLLSSLPDASFWGSLCPGQ